MIAPEGLIDYINVHFISKIGNGVQLGAITIAAKSLPKWVLFYTAEHECGLYQAQN